MRKLRIILASAVLFVLLSLGLGHTAPGVKIMDSLVYVFPSGAQFLKAVTFIGDLLVTGNITATGFVASGCDPTRATCRVAVKKDTANGNTGPANGEYWFRTDLNGNPTLQDFGETEPGLYLLRATSRGAADQAPVATGPGTTTFSNLPTDANSGKCMTYTTGGIYGSAACSGGTTAYTIASGPVFQGSVSNKFWAMGTQSGVAGSANLLVASANTIGNLQCRSGAPTAGKSYIFTLYKNEAATGITCTIADANITCADNVDTVSVVAGDRLTFNMTNAGAPGDTTQTCAVKAF